MTHHSNNNVDFVQDKLTKSIQLKYLKDFHVCLYVGHSVCEIMNQMNLAHRQEFILRISV